MLDGSVLKNDLKQKLAKERREERRRQQDGTVLTFLKKIIMDEFYIKVIYFQSGFTYFSLSVCMIDYTYSMHHIGLNAYTKSDKEGP